MQNRGSPFGELISSTAIVRVPKGLPGGAVVAASTSGDAIGAARDLASAAAGATSSPFELQAIPATIKEATAMQTITPLSNQLGHISGPPSILLPLTHIANHHLSFRKKEWRIQTRFFLSRQAIGDKSGPFF